MTKRIREEDTILKLESRCKTLNYTFKGFVGEYRGALKTKLHLYCNKHDLSWKTTTAYKFISGTKGCKSCKTEDFSSRFKQVWIGRKREGQESTQTVTAEEGNLLSYTCSLCSLDIELYPEEMTISKDRWSSGSINCGCSHKPTWTKEQYIVRCERKANTLPNITFIGIHDKGRRVTRQTKITLSCSSHHRWSTSDIGNFLRDIGGGCPTCAERSRVCGIYDHRLGDQDNLYLVKFVSKVNNSDSFVKVGRSFNPIGRFRSFPEEYKKTTLAILKDTHENIYKLEQVTHIYCEDRHYTPKIPFGGSVTECFSCEILEYPKIIEIFGLKDEHGISQPQNSLID